MLKLLRKSLQVTFGQPAIFAIAKTAFASHALELKG